MTPSLEADLRAFMSDDSVSDDAQSLPEVPPAGPDIEAQLRAFLEGSPQQPAEPTPQAPALEEQLREFVRSEGPSGSSPGVVDSGMEEQLRAYVTVDDQPKAGSSRATRTSSQQPVAPSVGGPQAAGGYDRIQAQLAAYVLAMDAGAPKELLPSLDALESQINDYLASQPAPAADSSPAAEASVAPAATAASPKVPARSSYAPRTVGSVDTQSRDEMRTALNWIKQRGDSGKQAPAIIAALRKKQVPAIHSAVDEKDELRAALDWVKKRKLAEATPDQTPAQSAAESPVSAAAPAPSSASPDSAKPKEPAVTAAAGVGEPAPASDHGPAPAEAALEAGLQGDSLAEPPPEPEAVGDERRSASPDPGTAGGSDAPAEAEASADALDEPKASDNGPDEAEVSADVLDEPQASDNGPAEAEASADALDEPKASDNGPAEAEASADAPDEPQASGLSPADAVDSGLDSALDDGEPGEAAASVADPAEDAAAAQAQAEDLTGAEQPQGAPGEAASDDSWLDTSELDDLFDGDSSDDGWGDASTDSWDEQDTPPADESDPVVEDQAEEQAEEQADDGKELCKNGHEQDPIWMSCPFCPAEDREEKAEAGEEEEAEGRDDWDKFEFGEDGESQEDGQVDMIRHMVDEEAYKALVADFTSMMVKALLRSGYYDPDHPEAAKAKLGLYKKFSTVMEGKFEVSFVSMVSRGHQELFIDGVLDTSFPLSKIMSSGMAEMFVPKMCQAFDRKNLLSITFKSRISEEHFELFIDLLTTPYEGLSLDEVRRHLGNQIKESGIKDVAVVFQDDVVGRGRRLSWRVEMALSRLVKDLRELPLLRDASAKKLRFLKRQIFEDIVRPLKQVSFVKELLVNLDVIADEFMQKQDLDVYEEFFLNLPERMVSPLAEEMFDDSAQYKGELHDPETEEDRKTLLKAVINNYTHYTIELAKRLARDPTPEGNLVLRKIVEGELVDLAKLPEDVQDFIKLAQTIDAFKENPEGHLKQLLDAQTANDYRHIGYVFVRVFPMLQEEERLTEIHGLFHALVGHRDESPETVEGRAELAADYYERLATLETIDHLRQVFLLQKREGRTTIAATFKLMAEAGVDPLLEILEQTTDDHTARHTIAALESMPSFALPKVIEILERPEIQWRFSISLLRLVQKIGSAEQVDFLTACVKHPHPDVRLQALSVYVDMIGKAAEPLVELIAIRERKAKVKLKALSVIAQVGGRSTKLIQYLVDQLDKLPRGATEKPEALQVQACRHFMVVGNIQLNEDGDTIETFLINVVRSEPDGFFGVGRSKYETKPVAVREAAARALARIGTVACRKVLKKLSVERPVSLYEMLVTKPEDQPVDLRQIGKDALQELNSRLEGSPDQPPTDAPPDSSGTPDD